MKVVWICNFSNSSVRDNLGLSNNKFEVLIRKLLNMPPKQWNDYGAWITNGIKEFQSYENVELHVISPHYGMHNILESFIIEGINYYFFKPEDDSLICKGYRNLFRYYKGKLKRNRKIIKKLIGIINPDIIHIYGAENPNYSISALDVDIKKYPLLLSLQTLMSVKDFKENFIISEKEFNYRLNIEQDVIKRTRYIGTSAQIYRDVIRDNINSDAYFFKTFLALEQTIPLINCEKKYDIVYFSVSIAKAADIAIEAFAIACKKYPNLTLNIIGGTPEPFTSNLKDRIEALNIKNNVIFSGKLPGHKDVLEQIQLSKFALLPLKVDGVSSTIREAMFAGIPVVTTITRSTPNLNINRKSVLISEQNDYKAIAENLLLLIESPKFANKLKTNALITAEENWNNGKIVKEQVECYNHIINHHKRGIPIPQE